jgi:hypothetical protein
MNVRNENDAQALVRGGWKFVTVEPYGMSKGFVFSKHRTRKAAEAAARGKGRFILDVSPDMHFQF